MPRHRLSFLASLTLGPMSLMAQVADRCGETPGAPFGVLALHCPNCSFEVKSGGRTTYTFLSEPVITDAKPGSVLAIGDVIEAVDTLPITTFAGADHFTYPRSGSHTLTVRRGRDRQELQLQLTTTCRAISSSSSSSATSSAPTSASASARSRSSGRGDDGVHLGSGSGSGQGIGTPVLGGDPLVIINGVPSSRGTGGAQIGRFGFAVECRDTCSSKRMPNGGYIYKYDKYPAIVAVRPGSVAEKTGLRVGDEVTMINGRSILDNDALDGSNASDELRLTIRREGKDIHVILLLTR